MLKTFAIIEVKMNVYDFDKTIYRGDSTVDLYFWCMFRNPIIIKTLPKNIVYYFFFKTKKINAEEYKKEFYHFLTKIKDINYELDMFWERHINKLEKWYLSQKKENDVIISASPEFLVHPCCQKLNVKCIASKVDCKTGELKSKNCKGIEKVHRFQQEYDLSEIDNFYSDSYSDKYIAKHAKKAYLVKRGKITRWKL